MRREEEAALVRHSRELLANDRLGALEGRESRPLNLVHSSRTDRDLLTFVDGIAAWQGVADEHDRMSIGSVESESDDLMEKRCVHVRVHVRMLMCMVWFCVRAGQPMKNRHVA